MGGASHCAGILETKLDGEWGHVNDLYYHFELRTAHDVCRQLDCGTAVSTKTNKIDDKTKKVEVICSGKHYTDTITPCSGEGS